MGGNGVSSPLRILNLALNLIHTPGGVSLDEATRVVDGYHSAHTDSARRMFERDIATLRDAGLIVDVSDDLPPRYSISSSALSSGGVNLSRQEVALLLRAADMWGISGPTLASLRHKLSGHAWDPLPDTAAAHMHLGEGEIVTSILRAIENRQFVEFNYAAKWGTATRTVTPWRLVARGRSLYLWGFDMDRWDARLFRLSRFTSQPQCVGESGDAEPYGPFREQPFDEASFLVAPLLLVNEGAAPATHSFSVAVDEEGDNNDLWQKRRGKSEDSGIWEDRLLAEAAGVVVLSPKWMRDSIRARLESARAFGKATHG